MDIVNRVQEESRERLPALALAVLVTLLIFAAINVGFTPQRETLLDAGSQQA